LLINKQKNMLHFCIKWKVIIVHTGLYCLEVYEWKDTNRSSAQHRLQSQPYSASEINEAVVNGVLFPVKTETHRQNRN